MKRRIAALILSIAIVVGILSYQGSFAWFVSSASKNQYISVAVVNYGSGASLDSMNVYDDGTTYIMPGDNLIVLNGVSSKFVVTNSSSINTQIRLKIEYTSYESGSANTVTYQGSDDEPLSVTFPENKWSFYKSSDEDSYFYYMGSEYKTQQLQSLDDVYDIKPTETSIEAIDSISYKNDSSVVSADVYSNSNVSVKIVFEAKQADFVSWETIGTYTKTSQPKAK